MIVVDVCVFACFDDISGADILKVVVQSNFWSYDRGQTLKWALKTLMTFDDHHTYIVGKYKQCQHTPVTLRSKSRSQRSFPFVWPILHIFAN